MLLDFTAESVLTSVIPPSHKSNCCRTLHCHIVLTLWKTFLVFHAGSRPLLWLSVLSWPALAEGGGTHKSGGEVDIPILHSLRFSPLNIPHSIMQTLFCKHFGDSNKSSKLAPFVF